MKKEPIHQNLSTSFVNVGALVRYLRGLQFVGSIRIELASYEAEIMFTESNTIRAREYDHIAGRISHGEHALERILVRAKESHGRINVYKGTAGYPGRDDGSVFVDKKIMTSARDLATSHGGTITDIGRVNVRNDSNGNSALILSELSYLLRVVDQSLASRKLSFAGAFRVACDGVARDYPFVHSSRGALTYKNGELSLHAPSADPDVVASAVFAALRPIFRRLHSEVKYSDLWDVMIERLRELSTERRTELINLGLMGRVENLLANA